MKKHNQVLLLVLSTTLIFTGCVANFEGKVPVTNPEVRFITGNENIPKTDYEVKGIVVVQRQMFYFDFFGLVKSPNKALSQVFTDDISANLTKKVIEIGGNAVMDIEIVNFAVLPGGFLYFLPLGSAQVTMQATAIYTK